MFAYIALLATTAWAGILSPRNAMRKILFFAPTFLIVGFKYDIGFDWHVYTEQFETFSQVPPGQFFDDFFVYVGLYAHEPLFVLLSYIGAQTLSIYELFYCVLFLFFVFSTMRLGKVVGTNTPAAFFVIHLFLLFTLEFSTLRQMVALSVLNLGIAFSLEGRRGKGLIFLVLAPLFQVSTAIFVLLFFLTRATRRLARIALVLALGGALVINSVGIAQFASVFSSLLPDIYVAKLTYYTEVRQYDFSMLEALFAIILYLVLGYFLFLNQKSDNHAVKLLSTFLLFLIAIALAGFVITTIRNRMLYEILTVSALLLFSKQTRKPVFIKPAVIALGHFFFAVSLTKPTSFMYVPYQNYLWFQIWGLESDGLDRQSQLESILRNR